MSDHREPEWRARRRTKILSSASRLFARSSYDLVQMDDVAAAAEVGKATLYRYFPSKDRLYLEVCSRAFERLQVSLDEAAQLPPVKALEKMVRSLIDVLADQVASLQLLSGERSPLADGWRALYSQQRRFILDSFRRVLASGMEQGVFRALDLEVAPRLLLGMVRGALTSSGLSRTDLATAMIDMVFNGTLQTDEAEPRAARRRARSGCRTVRPS